MQTLLRRELLPRAIGSLALMLFGAAAFALTAQESWIALTGLLASLGGLALLYRVIRLVREQAGNRSRTGTPLSVTQGCGFALLRAVLILGGIVAGGAWLWFAGNDMNEMRMLLFDPHYTSAQVIGKEIVPGNAIVGYVHYSYRATPTLAPESRFAVPHAQYGRYRVGQSFEVTYASSSPRVYRVGHVTWEFALRRAIYWLLLLANGAAYLFLPLWLLRMRLRASPRRQTV